MANGGKVIKEEEKPKPSFLIQAEAFVDRKFKDAESIKDPKYGPGLSSFDHKVFIGVMDLQMDHVNSVLVEQFRAEVAGHYNPIMKLLEKIDKNYDTLKYELAVLNLRQKKTDERISIEEEEILDLKKKLAAKKTRMDEFQKHMDLIDNIIKPEVIQDFLEKVDFVTPKLDKIIETQKTKTIAKRIALAVVISVAIMSTILSIVMYNHKKATFINKTIPNTEVPKDSSQVKTTIK
jgi:hypothetical protein